MKEVSSLPPEILGTNYVPSPEECNLIRQSLIPFHVERCSALGVEIDRIQPTLSALLLEQRTHSELINAHKALLAPMRRMVPDILLEIFHQCRSQVLEAPMLLARVCRKWRELVLSTPTLWTFVFLHDTLQIRRIVPFARACATYSGSCSITVVFKFMRRQERLGRKAIFDALAILARHVHRWRVFEVFLDNTLRPDNGFQLPDDAGLMESLTLMIDHPTSLPFSCLPKVRDLRLSSIQPQDIPLLPRCTLLRRVSIGPSRFSELTLLDCWSILSNCTEIEVFHVTSLKSDTTFPPMERITLSRLRDLRIGPFIPDPAPLIHCIKTPALLRLQLMAGHRVVVDTSCVRRLVGESQPPLTILSLVNVDGADVATCLPLLPDLTSLTIHHSSAMDLVINRLTEQDMGGRFNCPKLEHFGMKLCLFRGAGLVRLARERRGAAGGLRILVDTKSRYQIGEFVGLTIELSMVGEFSDSELKELYDMQTGA